MAGGDKQYEASPEKQNPAGAPGGLSRVPKPSPLRPGNDAKPLLDTRDLKLGRCAWNLFPRARHWDIPMLGGGPDGHTPPVTRRVSELERPQLTPRWGRFFGRTRRGDLDFVKLFHGNKPLK